MVIVGIDQSLNNTGMTILREGHEPSHFSVIPEKGMVGVRRTSMVSSRIRDIVAGTIEAGDHLVICREGYSYGSASSSVFDLGEMGGCIDMKLFESVNRDGIGSIKYYNIPPNSWKLLILGAGNVKKDTQYLLTAYNKTGIQFTDDNIADSHMIALSMKKILTASFDSLTLKDKMGMVSSNIRKKKKVTEKNIGKITEEEFKELVKATMREYLIFEFDGGNGGTGI
jgi:Holliday junction resolvasome RuvABC endonuclease subunit|nr:MAG TPA: HOLLIDAY JUNCTION RESOLVASE [Caudoviricetes sp.]